MTKARARICAREEKREGELYLQLTKRRDRVLIFLEEVTGEHNSKLQKNLFIEFNNEDCLSPQAVGMVHFSLMEALVTELMVSCRNLWVMEKSLLLFLRHRER